MRKLLLVFTFGLVALTSCAPAAGPVGENNRAASGAGSGASSAMAPDFLIVAYQGVDALGGKEVRLSEVLARGKPVILNFWAGRCPPCRAEMSDFQKVYEAHQNQVLLFGLDVGPFVGLGSREDGQALLKELQITYPAGTTFDQEVVRAYKVLGMPTTVFITPDGRIVRSQTGILLQRQMDQMIAELLKASG